MLKTAYAWILVHGIALALAALLIIIALLGLRSCGEKKDSAEAIVLKERLRVSDSVKASLAASVARQDSELKQALTDNVRVVDRWHESAPRPIIVGTPHDSVVQLTKQVRACRDAGDSLVASVVVIRSACEAFRDTAKKAIANLNLGIAQRDSLLKIPKPPKRWGIGIFGGYGLQNDGKSFALKSGAVVGVGLSYNIIRF